MNMILSSSGRKHAGVKGCRCCSFWVTHPKAVKAARRSFKRRERQMWRKNVSSM